MKYTAVTFELSEYTTEKAEILVAELSLFGFDSFEDTENNVVAYIPTDQWPENGIPEVLLLTERYPFIQSIAAEEMPDKDWNEVWESNFEPVVIAEQCLVYASFHTNLPKCKYNILINPKMAFGTGHHATTSQMVKLMMDIDFAGKTVLDMGCGTAVLSILAEMLGAKSIIGIDIDEWACNNSIENIALNHCKNISIREGDASIIGNEKFDIVLANINRNIILADIQYYAKALNKDGLLLTSGYYNEDFEQIRTSAEKSGGKVERKIDRNNWVACLFRF
jgi:ribosomal protein L11 methyltransferase